MDAGEASAGPITDRNRATQYLQENRVPQLFECLLGALMLEKPDDHLKFLQEKLEMIKEAGDDKVYWESLIYHLHPKRDKVRLEYIHNEERDFWSVIPKPFEFGEDEKLNMKTSTKPDLFELTEPQE